MPDYSQLPLLDLVPALSPQFRSPYHLGEWCEIMERAANREPLRALCCVPIRHYKTQTTNHGIVRILLKDPSTRIVHFSYSFQKAQATGKEIRDLATAAGVGPVRGTNTIEEWRNADGGGVVVMSADQSRLGLDCHCLVFDDPIDEFGAADPRVRDAADMSIAHYTARCMRDGKPGPVMGVMSRWHPDDPAGRRLKRTAVRWEYIHRRAIENEGTDDERAFAPDVWPLDALRKMRAELKEADPLEAIWWAQLQNEPRAAGVSLFGDAPSYYTELPTHSFRVGHGVDFAFSAEIHADFFALVSARLYGRKLYLLDIKRDKIDASIIQSHCESAITSYGRAPFWSYQSGPEIGTSRLLIERGIPIAVLPARFNKLVRGQRTIKRYNDGDILLPHESTGALWVPGFLDRVGIFRGHEKGVGDDEIDALVSLSDGMMGSPAAAPRTIGRPLGAMGLNSVRRWTPYT